MSAPERSDALSTYRAKRDFHDTPEPRGRRRRAKARRSKAGLYTIQKHAARRLHYDLRLELDGVLKSWAITRGPSLDPSDKRLAVRTEDHPLEYAEFEGRIPEGSYGAGTVLLWDRGSWEPLGDPHAGLKRGKLTFRLHGERLKGRWALVRFKGKEGGKRENWLLIKEKGASADRRREITAQETVSVASGRDLDAIATAPEAIWTSEDGAAESKTVRKKAPSRRRAAKGGKLPDFVEPALATLVDAVPRGAKWLFELKFDGYRAIAAVAGDKVRIHSRSGLDWTARYPTIAERLRDMNLPGVLLDGEIVAIDDKGHSDFGALQRALAAGGGGLSYFVFDLLEESGRSLRSKPLLERKTRLRALLGARGAKGPVYFTDHLKGHGEETYAALCDQGFEGAIAKRADAPYRSGRGRSWLKLKCAREQEFVVVGWSPSSRGRPFASLLLGLYEGGRLRYAGRVGSGFSEADLRALAKRLAALAIKSAPVSAPAAIARGVRWVKPRLVVEVGFAGFTGDGLVRQARFRGLREDKAARAVVRETAVPLEEAEDMTKQDREEIRVGGVRLTHPDKILFAKQGITKRDLATYFQAAADRMLPHLRQRLVSLLRCPDGRTKECFFQRHAGAGLPQSFRRFPVKEKGGGSKEYLYLKDAESLIAVAQVGVLELHLWGSRIDRIEQPDRLVFDLDPDSAIPFAAVKRAAVELRDALDALGLQGFALLTGGKGIHVVVPLLRGHEWPVVKGFARALAGRFAEQAPERYVATMSKAKRKGRIFIDHFRNDRSATAIAPYSPRAREGAPVAWPVTWERLKSVEASNAVTLEGGAERLEEADPWAGYHDLRQGLKAAALAALGL